MKMEQAAATAMPTAIPDPQDEFDFELDERMLRLHRGNVVTCPNCGWEGSWPTAVEIYPGDGGRVMRMDLETGRMTLRPELHGLCHRRQGLSIEIECGQCGAVGDPSGRLEIRGEGGNTVIEWTG